MMIQSRLWIFTFCLLTLTSLQRNDAFVPMLFSSSFSSSSLSLSQQQQQQQQRVLSSPAFINNNNRKKVILSILKSSSAAEDNNNNNNNVDNNNNNNKNNNNNNKVNHHHHPLDERRMREFIDLEPLNEPDVRKRRMEEMNRVKSQFVKFGDELWDLRTEMDVLCNKLMDAISRGKEFNNNNNERVEDEEETVATTRELLRQIEQRDPELVYLMELSNYEQAKDENRLIDAQMHYDKANEARSCLPQFNLEGLWVGKYGSHGYELINVTYVGDTLLATKVTGDKNVPRGELTFKADLHPMRHFERVSSSSNTNTKMNNNNNINKHSIKGSFLEPIELTEKAAQKWGTRQLPRYMGLGQVAEEGYINHQWMEGQLIIIGEQYFSFAWTPIQQQIFFGRPSPELALKMLRESGVSPLRNVMKTWDNPPSIEDDVQIQMEYLTRCFEVSDEVQDDHHHNIDSHGQISNHDGYGCIFYDNDSDECYFE